LREFLVLLMLQLPGCRKASISAMVGGALHRPLDADCPRAGGVGDDRACAAAMPRSQQVTKAAPKQSPAPVGSISSTLKAGAKTSPDWSK
jgi:hypothetical protein